MAVQHKIFWGVFAALAVGALMTERPETAPADASDARPQLGSLQAATAPAEGSFGGEIALVRQPDGHFYAQPVIGNSEINAMVDTGASFVALTGEDARAVGLSWDDAQLQPVARGANGVVEGVPVMIDRIDIAGTQIKDVQAAIIPEGLHVTLLGQSVLSRFDRVDVEGDTMTLAQD